MNRTALASTLILFTLGACSVASKLGFSGSTSTTTSAGTSPRSTSSASSASAGDDDSPAMTQQSEMFHLQHEFKTDVKRFEDALDVLDDMKNGKDARYTEQEQKQIAALAELVTLCKGKYEALAYKAEEYFERKEIVCPLAEHRDEIVTTWYGTALRDREGKRLARLQKSVPEALERGVINDYDLAPAAEFSAWVNAELAAARKAFPLLAKLPPGLFDSWKAERAQLGTAFANAIRVNRYDQYRSNKLDDPAIDKEARRIAAMSKHHAVVFVGSTASNPAIERSPAGRPLRKYRSILIVVRKNGESFCRGYEREFSASAEGGGKYLPYQAVSTPLGGDGMEKFILTSCK